MPNIGDLSVLVHGDTKPLVKDVEQAGKTSGKKFGSGFAQALGAAAIGAAIIGVTRQAEEAAIANARLTQVFKSMGEETTAAADASIAYADSLSRQIGVDDETIKAAQAKLATFSKVSDQLARDTGVYDRATKAAADLAATGFGSMESASVLLGKALQDPEKGVRALTRVGITLEESQKAQIKAMTEAGDVAGAQAVVLGAVEKQVGGVAEATLTAGKSFGIAFGEFQEAVGAAILPAMEQVMGAAGGMLDAFTALPQPIQTTAVGLALVGGAAVVLAPRIYATVTAAKAAAAAFAAWRTSAATSAAAFAAMTGPIGVAVAAVAALVGGLAALTSAQYKTRDAALDAREAFAENPAAETYAAAKEQADALAESVVRQARITREWSNEANSVGDNFRALGGGYASIFNDSPVEAQRAELSRLNADLAQYDQIISDVSLSSGVSEESVKSLTLALYDSDRSWLANKAAIEAAAAAQYGGTESAATLATATSLVADEATSAEDAVTAYKAALDALDGGFVDTQAAQDAVTRSLIDAKNSFKENGRTLSENTVAGLANREAVRGLSDDVRAHAAAVFEQTGDMAKANAVMADGRKKVVDMLVPLFKSRSAAEAYADKLGLIPDEIDTKVTADTKPATRTVDAYINKYDGKTINMYVVANDGVKRPVRYGSGAIERGSAQGDSFTSASPRWVGEQGPELFVPNRGGTIVPNYKLDNLTPTSAETNVRVFIGDRELTDIVRVEIDERDEQTALALAGMR